jgi:Putative DNA-binding domain
MVAPVSQMTPQALLERLNNNEDGFTERKTEAAKPAEFRQTLVAFANSVPEGQTAILFIGVANDGKVIGVTNSDTLQKKLRGIAENDCYPSVICQSQAFSSDGKNVVAVLIEASPERPHFAGPAFVRRGSESVAASKEVYEQLIASRNTKAGKILRNKDQLITFRQVDLDQWSRHKVRYEIECRIETCDSHVVHLHDIGSGRHLTFPLEIVRIHTDQSKRRLMLEAIGE